MEEEVEESPICEEDEREKANQCLQRLITDLNEFNLRTQDVVVVLGNLAYAVGASIEGIGEDGPTLDELNQRYYTEPTLGTALMLQGMITTSWHDQVAKGQVPDVDNTGDSNG